MNSSAQNRESHLPLDIFHSIIEFVDLSTLVQIEQVSREWRSAILTSLYWKVLYSNEKWNDGNDHSIISIQDNISWKVQYENRFRIEKNWERWNCSNCTFQHSSGVYALSFCDGTLAIGDAESKIKIQNMEDGAQIQQLRGYDSNMNGLNMKGKLLIYGSGDNAVRLYDWKKGTCLRLFRGHQLWVNEVILGEDIIVSGSGDNTVKLWQIETGDCIRTFRGHTESVLSVRFQSDLQQIYSGSKDSSLRMWDVRSGCGIHILRDHHDTVWTIHSNSKFVISGCLDNHIRFYETATARKVFELKNRAPVGGVYLCGNRIISASDDGFVRVWKNETCVQQIKVHSSWIYGFQCDLNQLVTADDTGQIKISDFSGTQRKKKRQQRE
jgi:WD40 repeat protein